MINLMVYSLFLIGILIMLYPFYISALNDYLDNVRVSLYKDSLQKAHEAQEKQLKAANEKLAKQGLTPSADPFKEGETSGISEDYYKKHLLGTVDIPKINIKIPLFDTTNSELLEIGATTLNGTSYPLGGQNTHAVISAHRGLPDRALFTDLPKLQKGDIFVLEVLGHKLAYEVKTIVVVKPEETQVLKIEPGQDLVTLLTCTPYMINSHRLLVTGSRVPYTAKVDKLLAQNDHKRKLIQLALLVLFTLLVCLMLWILYRIIHQYLLTKQTMSLVLQIITSDQSPYAQALHLYDRTGKRALKRQGQNVVLLPDATGTYRIDELAKGMYCLKTKDNALCLLIGQTKIKAMPYKLKVMKQSKLSFEQLSQQVIQIT
ncbi:MAG: class C sortase [Lactococcus plantarum]|nr:class C sortase [Lactococcus plantarum]MDN6084445.1 class C sortase [Lactococcus plantarum]